MLFVAGRVSLFIVRGVSMSPAFRDSDLVLVTRGFSAPMRGSVVLLNMRQVTGPNFRSSDSLGCPASGSYSRMGCSTSTESTIRSPIWEVCPQPLGRTA